MNESESTSDHDNRPSPPRNPATSQPANAASGRSSINDRRREARRWWIRLVAQPVLFLACGAALIAGLGFAQRLGFITAGSGGSAHASGGGESVRYICPMMCTPPQTEAGRCPVCAMELVPATSDGGKGDSRSIEIDPAARRVANIRTVAVRAVPLSRTIRAIGELSYDESTLKTISAYVDGRIERLYADYTGAVVREGDHLALLYSPELYSGQVELLLARRSRDQSRKASLQRVVQSAHDLYKDARRRLVELGVTDAQIQKLEQTGEASSRLHLCAPISGTVIEKLAVEGQYVQEGDAIYKLADLSTVWLMLKLFPEDAAAVRYGQKVEAEVQSLPGQAFTGRIAFIDPQVDPETRTVGVRVVMPNDRGLLRVGDYAKATVELGLTGRPAVAHEALVVPRDAVLMAGNHSVVYVETEPGRFELRRVVLGPSREHDIVLLDGVSEGDLVATRGNFLIDSQMQLAGNPSLIDPTKAESTQDSKQSAEIVAALSSLSAEDRKRAEHQRICPVTEMPLGSMGTPPKVDVNGTPVFICCEGCRESVLAEPEEYLARLATLQDSGPAEPRDVPMDLPPMVDLQMIDSAERAPPAAPPRQAELPQEVLR